MKLMDLDGFESSRTLTELKLRGSVSTTLWIGIAPVIP